MTAKRLARINITISHMFEYQIRRFQEELNLLSSNLLFDLRIWISDIGKTAINKSFNIPEADASRLTFVNSVEGLSAMIASFGWSITLSFFRFLTASDVDRVILTV